MKSRAKNITEVISFIEAPLVHEYLQDAPKTDPLKSGVSDGWHSVTTVLIPK